MLREASKKSVTPVMGIPGCLICSNGCIHTWRNVSLYHLPSGKESHSASTFVMYMNLHRGGYFGSPCVFLVYSAEKCEG